VDPLVITVDAASTLRLLILPPKQDGSCVSRRPPGWSQGGFVSGQPPLADRPGGGEGTTVVELW
jgi:hypothetical protein